MERHGKKPEFIYCSNSVDEIEKISSLIKEFHSTSYNSLGILCKTQKQAKSLFKELSPMHSEVNLINFECTEYKEGIIITTTHMAKGLEFDWAIVSNASANNYSSEIDNGLLYIAITRAMHRLDFTYIENISKFLADNA
ncbi:MAG: 3'-5' exonuclease [Muricomes sp.]